MLRSERFRGYYSLPKLIFFELGLLALGIVPLLPGVSRRLQYTAALYQNPLWYFLIFCCVVMVTFALLLVPMLLRSLSRLPAVEIDGNKMTIFRLKRKEYLLRDIASVKDLNGTQVLVLSNGKEVAFPVLFMSNSADIVSALRGAIESGR